MYDITLSMPTKLKNKWLKALRSGEYGQCKGKLTDGEGNFCCLGVLQHVATGGMCEVREYQDEFASMPTISWAKSVGIEAARLVGSVTYKADSDINAVFMDLAAMNDGSSDYDFEGNAVRRKTFKQIAKWIEKNVEVY